jgi:hypothetical protein
MANRGWHLGWPAYSWAKPIKDVLANEEISAQAQARQAQITASNHAEAQRELARQEHVEALKQEQQMLKAARGDVLAALVLAAELVPSMRQIVRAVAEQCKPGPNGEPPKIAAAVAMGLVTRHATLIQKAVGAAECVIQLSRLDRGASTVNVGLATPDEDISDEDALAELAAIEGVLRAATTPKPALALARRNGV